jgi:hypothetical protein
MPSSDDRHRKCCGTVSGVALKMQAVVTGDRQWQLVPGFRIAIRSKPAAEQFSVLLTPVLNMTLLIIFHKHFYPSVQPD